MDCRGERVWGGRCVKERLLGERMQGYIRYSFMSSSSKPTCLGWSGICTSEKQMEMF